MRKSIYTQRQQCFVALLRQIRLDAGLTQAELAERLDTPQTRISDYERGLRRLDLPQLQQVCEAVGVPLTDFVGRYLAGLPSQP